MKDKKMIFEIQGYTYRNKYVSSGSFIQLTDAFDIFAQKYPKFKGRAKILAHEAEVVDEKDNIFIYTYNLNKIIGYIRNVDQVKARTYILENEERAIII